ncbi:HD domain-containing protein [Tenacibaculum sp. SG-28]|uniref:HD domain-containing protein n=1 Tax=Tenacibaculum sp. SG-28 TaxID=754426 RepID=UPI000CF50A53|nr:HD domain-containing protein [Tenacibaculum sp. SG-28]PQJ21884.1 phosphohydrolase [Tenacibaculum sp. SG-28]
MDQDKIIQETIAFVKSTLHQAEGGHDFFHVERVYKNALKIAENEQVDTFIVAIGALLHDIADSKFHNGDETVGPKKAREFLASFSVPETNILAVENIIKHISFKGGNFEKTYTSLELQVIQDADRLDAIGAIGIARCFNYGGYKNRKIYDPAIPPNLTMTKEEYKKATAPSINHFYEKLLLLKDKMNTKTGRILAAERHEFMEQFLLQFYKEWDS